MMYLRDYCRHTTPATPDPTDECVAVRDLTKCPEWPCEGPVSFQPSNSSRHLASDIVPDLLVATEVGTPLIALFMGHMGHIWGRQDPGGPHVGPYEPCYRGIMLGQVGTSLAASDRNEQKPNCVRNRSILHNAWSVGPCVVLDLGVNMIGQDFITVLFRI